MFLFSGNFKFFVYYRTNFNAKTIFFVPDSGKGVAKDALAAAPFLKNANALRAKLEMIISWTTFPVVEALVVADHCPIR